MTLAHTSNQNIAAMVTVVSGALFVGSQAVTNSLYDEFMIQAVSGIYLQFQC